MIRNFGEFCENLFMIVFVVVPVSMVLGTILATWAGYVPQVPHAAHKAPVAAPMPDLAGLIAADMEKRGCSFTHAGRIHTLTHC